jgi:tRNA pseudouridine38-40 synthase
VRNFAGKAEMNNYKLTIQYDGTMYSGWQIQAKENTVQQKVSDSIGIILKEKVSLIGSGRTDTGVHALGQIANFRTVHTFDPNKFLYSLNSILPSDIGVLQLEKVSENFHARFDAKKRTYIYLISKHKSPFFFKYSYFYHYNTDCRLLNELSSIVIGKKDFTSFARKHSDTKNKICEVYEARWRETRDMVLFYITADRFLHGMVRTIVGTLLHTLKNDLDNKYLENIFAENDRTIAAEAVPAKGLFLFKVKY